MSHPLQCRCGTVKGFVDSPQAALRIVCYCRDCQAFAHFLNRVDDVLDERGGSDIVQTLPKYLNFTQGVDRLAIMRLKPKGLLRWYASCCNTPIGNTLDTPKASFVGLVHSCLRDPNLADPSQALQRSFGAVVGAVYTKSAKGEPKPPETAKGKMVFRIIKQLAKARFNGDWKRTPLFKAGSWAPIVAPRVLTPEEHTRVMAAVAAATG